MPSSLSYQPSSDNTAAQRMPPAFRGYDGDGNTGFEAHQQQPLRRRGAPVPAPPSLLSTRSSLLATPRENPYESTTPGARSTTTSSGGTATTSPPPPNQQQQQQQQRRREHHAPLSSTTTTTTTTRTASSTSATTSTAASSSSSPSVRPTRRTGSAATASSASVTAAPTPHNTTALFTAAERGPAIVRASTPSLATPSSMRSVREAAPQQQQQDSVARSGKDDRHQRRTVSVSGSGSGERSRSTTGSRTSALPPHMRQETGVPSPSPALSPAHTTTTASSPSERVVTAAPVIMSNAERKKAEQEARRQLRSSLYEGNIKVHGYVAQSAYAQKNPFRQQDFAEFAANPKYTPPAGFDIYSQAMATRVYGLEVSRASQGEFMMQRLVDAAHPASAAERTEMEALLSSTLEKLQVGDWFYKWTRINHVHQRYVWLNLQRGTLMWSLSPKQSVVLNAELKLSTVTSITPDCLQLEAPMRVFYRMTVNTPDRCISLATEIRKKFDVWYRVLLQLTAPNLVYGVPGVWGRPSSSVNTTGRGAASRWASRFSPLDAVANDTTGHLGPDELYTQGLLSSSD